MKKILHTYFFGYAAYKYRRLFRTSLIILFISILMIGIFNINYLPFGKGDIIEKIYKEYPLLVTPSKNYYTEKEANILFQDSLNVYFKQGLLKKVIVTKKEYIDLLTKEEKVDDEFNRTRAINALLISINKDNFFNDPSYGTGFYNEIYEYELKEKLGIAPFFEKNDEFKNCILIIFYGLLVVGLISFIIEPFITEKNKNNMN